MIPKIKTSERFSFVKVIKNKRKVVLFSILIGSCGSGYGVYKNFISEKDEAVHYEEKSEYIYLPSPKLATPGMPSTSTMPSITEQALKGMICYKMLQAIKFDKQKTRGIIINDVFSTIQLEDFQYRTMAQAIDIGHSIGLARTPDVSLKFFLPPSPLLFYPKISEEEHFLQIFSAVPVLDCNEFIQLKTKEAVELVLSRNEFHSNTNIFGTPDSEQYYEHKKNHDSTEYRTLLLALLAHSTIPHHRIILVQKKLLSLLHTVSGYIDDDLKCLVAQIIANLAIDEFLHPKIFLAGWFGVLVSWSRSHNNELSISAAKALANMDRKYENNHFYDDGIYLLYPQFRTRDISPVADIVFVHGVMGGVFRTWRQHDSMKPEYIKEKIMAHSTSKSNEDSDYTYCWPKDWLPSDIPYIRILAVDYNSHFTEWKKMYHTHQENEDLQTRCTNILMKLAEAGVGSRPVVFVGHSMGGIIVKQMLVDAIGSEKKSINAIARNTSGVVFYSVPHKGTEVASFSSHYQRILKPSTEIQQLKKGSPQLLELHENFRKLVIHQNIKCLSFGETIKSKIGLNWNAVLVPSDSADPQLGEFYEIPSNHLSTCKPLSKDCASYQLFVGYMKSLLFRFVSENEIEMNSPPVIDWSTFF